MSVTPTPDTPTLPRLAARWARLIPLTGLTVTQYWHVTGQVAATQPKRHRRGRRWRLPLPLRVLLALVALRTNVPERALAALFATSQPSVNRTITALLPVLAGLLSDPVPEDATWIVDGTLIPPCMTTPGPPSRRTTVAVATYRSWLATTTAQS